MDGIDLTGFADPIATAKADGRTMVVATSGPEGPDVAYRGSVLVWDKDHLAYWDRGVGESFANVRAQPRVAAFLHSPDRGVKRPLRLYGTARLVEDPALREQVWERIIESERKGDPEKKGSAVLVRIDRVRSGSEDVQRR